MHDELGYWKRARVSRYTIIRGAGTAGVGLAAAALVGCGGNSGTQAATQSPGGSPGASVQPNMGGTLRTPNGGASTVDPTTLYPFENVGFVVQTLSANHYSRLLRGLSGPDISPTDYTKVEGDMAQKVPEQPDPLTYTFKLKPNIAFHNKPPMNGRLATAQDFLATYDYFSHQAVNRARFNDVVDRIEAPDAGTIKFTLKSPNATFIANFAASDQGCWFIPVETINNDQIHTDPVGTGPWVFKSFTPGVSMVWERHPKYYDSPQPYFSKLETSLGVKDATRVMTALQAGDFDYSGLLLSQLPDIKTKLDPNGQTIISKVSNVIGFMFNFNVKPWNDLRVRQALSMAIDRAGVAKALDPSGTTGWTSFVGPALDPFYIDPQDQKTFGPNAVYFQRNIAEAKKLLQAATGGETLNVNILSNVDAYGAAAQQQWELLAAMMREAGFNAQNVYQDYGTYIQATPFGKFADPKGVALGYLIGTVLDPDDMFFTCYWSGSARHNWNGPPIPEQAQLDAMFVKQRGLLDLTERTAYIQEIQRTMAASFLTVPGLNPPAPTYIQPWVKNAYLKSTYASRIESFNRAYFDSGRLSKG